MADSGGPLAIIEGIPYGKGREERFDLYAANWKRSRRPIVVLLGGSWRQPRARKPYVEVARALVEDGALVAMPEYAPPTAAWPQQIFDLRRALAVIAREAEALGGDAQHLILCGDGLGAFLAAHLVLTQRQLRWLASNTATITAWMANDGVWSEESLETLPTGHLLRQMFPDPAIWNDVRPLHLVRDGLPPALIIQSPSANLEETERFARQSVAQGNEVMLIPRPESGARIWRDIANHAHPLRVMWRPWLQRVGHGSSAT